jgi:hypothetical protein
LSSSANPNSSWNSNIRLQHPIFPGCSAAGSDVKAASWLDYSTLPINRSWQWITTLILNRSVTSSDPGRDPKNKTFALLTKNRLMRNMMKRGHEE